MIRLWYALRFRSTFQKKSSTNLISEYLKKREEQKIKQEQRLKDECKKTTTVVTPMVQSEETEGAYQKCSPEHSQETLFNYFNTRTGRMLRTSVAAHLEEGKKPEFDVFYSAEGVKAMSEQNTRHTQMEIRAFGQLDPRKPISGLMIFMWNIRGPQAKRRHQIWKTLPESERIDYSRKAQAKSPKLEYFDLNPTSNTKLSESEFREFIDKYWYTAERLVEDSCLQMNTFFLKRMEKTLRHIYAHIQSGGSVDAEVIHDPPLTAFDNFATEKNVSVSSSTNLLKNYAERERHTSLWNEWCALTDEERNKFFVTPEKIPPVNIRRQHVESTFLPTIKESKALKNFLRENFVKINETVDKAYRKKTEAREKDITKSSRTIFKYSKLFRESFWSDMEKELRRTYIPKS